MEDKKETKWDWKKIIEYIIMGLVGILLAGGIAWLIYSNMKVGEPESIIITARKST